MRNLKGGRTRLCQRLTSVLLEGVVWWARPGDLDLRPLALPTRANHLLSLGLHELICKMGVMRCTLSFTLGYSQ